ncbi:MAG: fibronectin type III domain-containing protein [Patescibacteria group bacterium]
MQQRKIPTIVGLLLVVAAVMVFRFAFDRVTPLLTKAVSTHAPKNVTVTNITDASFTVTWTTDDEVSGSVRLDGVNPDNFFFDERYSTANTKPATAAYTTHSVVVRNLKPDTGYKFVIVSNNVSYTNNGVSYEVKTAPAISGLGTGIEPAYGQITATNGLPLDGALVYLTLENGQTLSTLSKTTGTWVIPLNLARTTSLDRYLPVAERINESIVIRSADGESTALTDTLNDNPVPSMTVGKTYDFRKIQAETIGQPPLAAAPAAQPAVLGETTEVKKQTVAIVKPADGSAIPSNLPLIQGTGVGGNPLLVTIGIEKPMSDTVIIGNDGVWRYTPIKPLAPGKQSVTITTKDAQNKTVALTHTFEILKSGTQVLGDATPSATLTPEPTVTDDPTPTATLAGEPIPETGFPLPLIVLLILGLGIFGGGAFSLRR